MITLKQAREKDCELIFRWRNHPKVRKYFFDPSEISYSEHKKWFEESLQRDDMIILLAYDDRQEVGVIRFDIVTNEPQAAEIDIYVAPERQGQGIGKMILAEGENWIKQNTQIKDLIAKVKEDNQASLKMFKWCDFKPKYTLFKKAIGSFDGT